MERSEVLEILQEQIETIQNGNESFESLFQNDRATHPIPFSGHVSEASILTVGVNPSATEFKDAELPESLGPDWLYDRQVNYFDQHEIHDWFGTWDKTLDHLDVSYEDGNAAHLDLSPRATKAMRRVEKSDFQKMVRRDIGWFFRLLPFYENARVLLMAGMVKGDDMCDFVAGEASKHGFEMEGARERKAKSNGVAEYGRVGFYCLRSEQVELPVFFCSISPSSHPRYNPDEVLPSRVKENRDEIEKIIDDCEGLETALSTLN